MDYEAWSCGLHRNSRNMQALAGCPGLLSLRLCEFRQGAPFSLRGRSACRWEESVYPRINPAQSSSKQTLGPSRGKGWLVLDRKAIHFYCCNILKRCNILDVDNCLTFSDVCLVCKVLNGLVWPLNDLIQEKIDQNVWWWCELARQPHGINYTVHIRHHDNLYKIHSNIVPSHHNPSYLLFRF